MSYPEWFSEGYRHIWMPYTQMQTSPLPQAVKSTHGCRINLQDGRELIDGISSWWSACHGYNHPHIMDAIHKQLDLMPHVMLAGLSNQPAFTLAKRLADMTPGDLNRVFLSESGSVSVEIALKMAVQYWINQGISGRYKFVSFKDGYHGDTIGTMGIGDPDNLLHGPFKGLMAEQTVCDLPRSENSRQAFSDFLERHKNSCAAVIIEPLVQGAGGMIFHDIETLRFLRDVCDAQGVLLIFDEIMVGLGRLGSKFACNQAGVIPDIMTLSKSLTGGTMPLAATIATERIFTQFLSDELTDCLMHGPTFTGHALASAAANASLDLFEREPRMEQVQNIEAHLASALAVCSDIPGVRDVRVRGALGVVELPDLGDMYWIRQRFIDESCWVRPFGNTVYLMPSFTINTEDLAHLTDSLVKIVGEWSDRYYRRAGLE